MQPTEIQRVLEAALLCAEDPLEINDLCQLFAGSATASVVRHQLVALQAAWQARGLELVQVAGGWRFQSRPEIQPYLMRLNREKTPRYSRAVLETLAIIAWRQPVTRGDIEDIRGVTVSTQIIRSLEGRDWIETCGHKDAPGRPALFRTTRRFLDDLGLRSLDELPALTDAHASVQALDALIAGERQKKPPIQP